MTTNPQNHVEQLKVMAAYLTSCGWSVVPPMEFRLMELSKTQVDRGYHAIY